MIAGAARGRGRVRVTGETIIDPPRARRGRRASIDFSEHLRIRRLPPVKFRRSNQDTCVNQQPIVSEGQRVEARPGARRRSRDPRRRARARRERARRLHAVVRVQLRGRDPRQREDRQAATSSPRFTSRSSSFRSATRSAAWKRSPGKSRTSRRTRSGTSTRRAIIRIGAPVQPGDILVGKVTPEGRDRSLPGRAPAAGDLRRQGRRRARRLAQGASRDGRHRHRHQGLLPQGEGRDDQEAGEEEDRQAEARTRRRRRERITEVRNDDG